MTTTAATTAREIKNEMTDNIMDITVYGMYYTGWIGSIRKGTENGTFDIYDSEEEQWVTIGNDDLWKAALATARYYKKGFNGACDPEKVSRDLRLFAKNMVTLGNLVKKAEAGKPVNEDKMEETNNIVGCILDAVITTDIVQFAAYGKVIYG